VTFGNTDLPNRVVTGMPLRSEIEGLDVGSSRELARVSFGLDPQATTILVTGGSLGAKRINEAVLAARPVLEAAGVQVLHIVGKAAGLPEEKAGGYLRLEYRDRMDQAFAAADLVISRAGASTVSEISALGLPAIYVPYPVGNGEQAFNAADSVAAGAAKLVSDADFDAGYIASEVIPLVSSRPKLTELSRQARQIGIRNGAARLLALVAGVLRRTN
jgi:UDP-N-acetylglucosamine--N-acetylmuramyl-(pentapeptide) pyrophosphoryl-undecaprenol N-acetylglucosamine transferase